MHKDTALIVPELAMPRPNGSRVLKETVSAVGVWLEGQGITVEKQAFILRPYFMELLGAWMAITGVLFPIAALGRWGWGGIVLALLALAVPLLELRWLVPTITRLVQHPAENLVVSFPANQTKNTPMPREVILCAHLDSKTELLDHKQREVLYGTSGPAMGLAVLCGLGITVEPWLPTNVSAIIRWAAFGAGLVAAFYELGIGMNLLGGRFHPHPSTGAVDNGAAVAVLLTLAQRLQHKALKLQQTSVTLLFTIGEEAQLQGALAYVQERTPWPEQVWCVNLEILGQNGDYALWETDGTAMVTQAADADLNASLAQAVETVTGSPPIREPRMSSDAYAFQRAGIPATTLGSLDRQLRERGFHSAKDNLDRLHPAKITEAEQILERLLWMLDNNK